ncbi:hypothetical protein, partial [Prevotellamassilia timonensis]|uniref:hypothetical protein n=1 Tax=Prevotellamassilia timonensis TaxID=1852370 RepID=UPI00307D7F11
ILNRRYCFLYHLRRISLCAFYIMANAISPTKITDSYEKVQLQGCSFAYMRQNCASARKTVSLFDGNFERP